MVSYTLAKIRHVLKLDFIRFCIVGGVGFVINFILLTLLRHVFNLPVFIAQLIAAEIALFCNFMLHHHWTYKAHKVQKTFRRLILQFHASSWPAIIGSAVMVAAGHRLLHLSNLWALILSSIIALGWNFTWSKYVIWKGITKSEIEESAA